jgi:hypothetical protein
MSTVPKNPTNRALFANTSFLFRRRSPSGSPSGKGPGNDGSIGCGFGDEDDDKCGSSSKSDPKRRRGFPSDATTLRSCLKQVSRTDAAQSSSAMSQECAPISPTPRSPHQPARRVGWGTATFHHHPPILGDEVCSSGPPLSIGWRPFKSVTVGVDEYDAAQSALRRAKSQLLLPRGAREQILRDAGFSRASLARAAEQALKDRIRRARSARDGRLRRAICSAPKALMLPFLPRRRASYGSNR